MQPSRASGSSGFAEQLGHGRWLVAGTFVGARADLPPGVVQVHAHAADPGPGEEEAGEAVRVGSRVVARGSVEHGDNGGVSVNNLNGGGWR